MPYRRVYRKGYILECSCLRCGHAWRTEDETIPKSCAACKSKLWDTPRVRKVYERKEEDPKTSS